MLSACLLLGFLLIALVTLPAHAQSPVVSTVVSKFFTVYSSTAPAAGGAGVTLVMGVGTGMSTNDYSDVAIAMVQALPDFFIVVVDSFPGWFVKTDSTRFAETLTSVDQWFTQQNIRVEGWLLGGHSASGRACVEALNKGLITLTGGPMLGFIGFDPYDWQSNAQNLYNLKLPTLIYAKTKKDCVTDIPHSGTGFHAHAISPASSCAAHNLLTFTDGTEHCVFTNGGCASMCGSPGSVTHAAALHNIANAIKNFVESGYAQLTRSPIANAALTSFRSCNGMPGNGEL